VVGEEKKKLEKGWVSGRRNVGAFTMFSSTHRYGEKYNVASHVVTENVCVREHKKWRYVINLCFVEKLPMTVHKKGKLLSYFVIAITWGIIMIYYFSSK
jgi:hypothetical protein